MQLSGKLAEADLDDLQVRSKMYWPKFILMNWYGIGLICVALAATITGFLGYTKPNWQALGVIWLIITLIIGWAVSSTKRQTAREFTTLNTNLPEWLSLADDGVKCDGPNGAMGFHPWRNFSCWREGKRVVMIDQSTGGGFVILPVADLSEIERESIRGILKAHLPPLP